MRREHFTFIVAAAALFGGGMIGVVLYPPSAEALGHFGDYLGGLAAFIGIVVLVTKGSQEFDDWKQRQRHDKQSEIAGQVIVAATAFADSMRLFAAPEVFTSDPKRGDGEELGAHILAVANARQELIRTDVDAFVAARKLAEAYLPDDALAAVRDFWELYREMKRAYSRWSALADSRGDLQLPLIDASDRVRPMLSALLGVLRKHTVGGDPTSIENDSAS